LADHIKNCEIGGARGPYRGERGRKETFTTFLWGNLKQKDHFEDLEMNGKLKLKSVLKKYDRRKCIGLSWLRISTIGRLMWI